MKASDISAAISALRQADIYIMAHVPPGTQSRIDLVMQLERVSRKLESHLSTISVDLKTDQ